jgi:hypothetical protein
MTSENDENSILEYLKEDPDRFAEFTLANQIAMSLQLRNSMDEYFTNPVPTDVVEYVERVWSGLWEAAALLQRKNHHSPLLRDRSLYDIGEIDWNEGITLEHILKHFDDTDFEYDHEPGEKILNATLSGFYNRLFPVKFCLRVLLTLHMDMPTLLVDDKFGEHGSGLVEVHQDPTIINFRKRASQMAAFTRDAFLEIDQTTGQGHGANLTVAFPSSNQQKSIERFETQFVGSSRDYGRGALCELGLMNIDEDGNVKISLHGIEFALLENPIIDQHLPKAWKNGTTLSDKEINWLLSYIKWKLPVEFDFMSTTIEHIKEANNTPNKLDGALATKFGWSGSEASTMRKGVIGRMQEMRLIVREKKGRTVTYQVTTLGSALIQPPD